MIEGLKAGDVVCVKGSSHHARLVIRLYLKFWLVRYLGDNISVGMWEHNFTPLSPIEQLLIMSSDDEV